MELSQVLTALQRADQAGNTEDARELAQLARRLMAEQQAAPAEEALTPKPKTGIGAAIGKGFESLISSGRTALGALTGSPEEAAQAGLERGRQIGEKYEDQVSLDRVKQAYEERGFLPAAGEALSQIPAAIAEQVPNLGVMVGGARLGAMAGAPFGPIGATVGGIGGALAPSLVQQFGGNIERQAQEGAPISTGRAAAAAAPQAALDVAAQAIPFGGRLVQKLTGIPMGAFFSKSAAQAEKIANERLLATLVKGTAVGALAEIPTEITQQMLERAQAGLSLTSPDAMKEYGETAYQVGLLAPLGAVGRLSERSGARAQVEEKKQAESAAAAAEQAAKEQAELDSPEYAEGLKAKLVAAEAEMRRLSEAAKKPPEGADALAVQDAKDAAKARAEYAKNTVAPLVKELQRVRGLHPDLFKTPIVPTPAAPATVTPPPAAAPAAAMPATVTPAPGEVAPEVSAPVSELEVLQAKQRPVATATPMPEVPQAPEVAAVPAPDDLVDSYIEAFMGDPTVAAEMVKANEQIPGLSDEQQAAVMEGLAQRLAQLELEGVEVPAAPAVKKTKGKKAPAVAVAPAVEDTTVEPTEPKTLEEAFQPAPIEEEPRIISTKSIRELYADLLQARREGRRGDARDLVAELRQRTDKSQLRIPDTELPTTQIPLTRTGSGISPEALRDVQAELKRLSKEFISARQEGRKNDAQAILERMRYLRSQGISEEMGPQIRGSIEVPGTQTLTAIPTSPTSTAGVREEISRIRSTVALTDQQSALLDRIDDNLSALREYRPEIAELLTNLRQRRSAPETEQYLQQQLSAIEQKAQQQITPRELNGMLVKTAKLPLSGKERGLLKLIGENQSPIMGDGEARRIVANWLMQDVGQGVGAATETLRSYFGVAQEQKAQVSPVSKAVADRTQKIETEYEEAKQALEKANADAGVSLQEQAASIQRIETQVARAQAAVRAAEDKVNTAPTAGAKKVAATGLANRQNALEELTQKLAAANKDYREQQQKLITESPQVKAASERFEKAREPKRLLDTLNTSESGGARQDARNALNELMPLPKTEAAPAREKVTAPAVQTDMFAEEIAPAQVKKTVEEGRAAQREAAKKSEERDEAAISQRKREAELTALPAQRISFEKRREMLRQIDDAPRKREALEDMINDANLPQAERDAAQEKLTTYLAKLRKKAETKDASYATAYRLRGEESALVQELKERLEATDLTEKQREKLNGRYEAAKAQLIKRDNQLARLRGVEISAVETPQQRTKTLENLHRQTYGQALTDEEQELLESQPKGRALGPVMRKAVQPSKVLYTGDKEELGKTETEKRTYTRPDMRLTEARGTKQRDVAISSEEMQEANKPKKDAPVILTKQEQEFLDYKNQVDAAVSKISNLNIKLDAVKERQAVLEKQRTTAAEAAAGVRTQWTKEKAAALNEQQESIQKELDRAKDEWARLTSGESDAAEVEAAESAQRAEINKYEKYLKELRKRVPKADRERVFVMYRGTRTPAADVITKVAATIKRLKEDFSAALPGETGKTTLSAKSKKGVERLREGTTDFAFRQSTDLTGDTLEAVKDGRILDALQSIEDSTQSEFVRELAQKLRPLLLRTKLRVEDNLESDGKRVSGVYRFETNTVLLDSQALTEEDFLHELVHAATERNLTVDPSQLTAEQREARAQLEELFHAIQNDSAFEKEYGKLNLHEFAAEVMSNKQLRDKLDTRRWKGANLLTKIYRAFMHLIGLNPDRMAGASVDAIYKLFSPSMTAAKAGVTLGEYGVVRPSAVRYAPGLEGVGKTADKVVAKDRGAIDKVRAAAGGWLGLETQFVDRFAGFERIAKTMDSLKGFQMMYFLRMYDQKMNFTAQSVANGALQRVAKKRADGRTEYLIESVKGANIKQVVDILKKAPAGSPDAANRLFSLYLAGIRAKNKGFETLHFGKEVTEAELNKAMADIRAVPGLEENFKQAREVYNEYNRNMMEFLAQSGAISKDLAARLTKENDYIPFYREQRGSVELLIGGESPIRIGNLTEQPYLQELVGGDRPILDFLTSSVQNTAMITDMALRNMSTRSAMNELADVKLAQIHEGKGPDDRTTVRFKVDGKDYYARVETDKAGIPADLLVKGMAGIPTQFPAAVRLMGMPATLLRKAVQISPLYPVRQLFRDSLAATLTSGANFTPIIGSLAEIKKSATKDTLERRGITGGQIITGTSEDMSKILKDMLSDRGFIGRRIAQAEAINMEADAATRRAQYNSYIKQGLSEMEATLMALESMNFNKRGASPSIHYANALIPFFNSQIQGLNVLYKAMTGKLPFNERLKIQEKFITRGLMIAAGSMAYAAMMQDDEAYKNATPDQKYGNWFVRLPGVDEPVRIPIPFEVGYIFKALPEALYNSIANEHGAEEAFKALQTIVKNTIPGGSSYFVPQAMKPLLEYGFEKSFYTGRSTLSAREQQLLPEQQFRENTTELTKMMGAGLGLSPIKVEELVRGYTGTMGLLLMQVMSMGIPAGESPEKTAKRLSNMPVFGGAFQPNDAGGIIEAVYQKMVDAKKVQTTAERMMQEGRQAEARELVNRRSEEFAQAGVADYFVSRIRQITAVENAIRASNMTGEEKRAKLDETRQIKIRLAESVRKATDEAKTAA